MTTPPDIRCLRCGESAIAGPAPPLTPIQQRLVELNLLAAPVLFKPGFSFVMEAEREYALCAACKAKR